MRMGNANAREAHAQVAQAVGQAHIGDAHLEMREPRRLAKRIGAKDRGGSSLTLRNRRRRVSIRAAAIGLGSFDVAVVLEVQVGRENDSATKKIKDGKRADERKMETR